MALGAQMHEIEVLLQGVRINSEATEATEE